MSKGESLLHAHMRITLDFTVDIVDTLNEGDPQKRLLRNLVAHGRNEQYTLHEYLLLCIIFNHLADQDYSGWLEAFFEEVTEPTGSKGWDDAASETILAPILAFDPSAAIRYETPDGSPGSLFTEDMDACIKTELTQVHVQDTLQGESQAIAWESEEEE